MKLPLNAETSLFLVTDESGSTIPLVVGVVLLSVLLIFASLATAEMATERARQQSAADLGALAGANTLAKATNTSRLIDGVIYTRNVSLDAMYLAATIVSIASAGTGAEAFEVPAGFQKNTEEAIAALEKTKAAIGETAVVYAIADGATVIKANGGDSGLALPIPLTSGSSEASQAEKDLMREIEMYDIRLKISMPRMYEAMQSYNAKKEALKEAGLSDDEIKRNEEVVDLRAKVHEATGRVGGQTSQRNKHRKALATMKKKSLVLVGGQTGVVAVVYHQSSEIPFTQPLGGIETGSNLAIAGARAEDGPIDKTVGEEAIANLLSKIGLKSNGDAANRILEGLNIAGGKIRNLKNDYGPIGGYLAEAIDRFGLTPPSLTETRPSLASVDSVITDGSDIYASIKQAIGMAEALEAKLGVDILPAGLEF